MAFTSWRGVVGCIKPTLRPGGLEELIRMLPDGIGVLPLFLNIRHGTTEEFRRATAPYEPLVKQQGVTRVDFSAAWKARAGIHIFRFPGKVASLEIITPFRRAVP